MSEPAARATPNLPEFSVTEISSALKRTVEDAFGFVRVRGEISNLKFHSSGHIYFDLKDEKACLNAVVWRTGAGRLRQKPQAGLEVVCTGKISTYAGSSRYQIIVEQVELAGAGALMAMLEERKKKLAAEGLFDAAHKKKLPFLPEVIGVVTSPTGAVIRDIMHRLEARFPRRVLLWPVAVQGERAAAEVAAAIRGLNAIGPGHALPRPDLIIVARGGGSIEDLMAFNDEAVVRAAFESVIPLISAVGHETDTTLIDFASDVRAPTPTAAAELAVPVRAELLGQNLDFARRLLRVFSKAMDDRRRHLGQLARVLPRADALFAQPRQRLDFAGENLGKALRTNLQVHDRRLTKAGAALRPTDLRRNLKREGERAELLGKRLARAGRARLTELAKHLDSLGRVLEGTSYRSALERGFALVRGEDGKVRRRAAQVTEGESLTLTFADGEVPATASGTAPQKPKSRGKPGGGQGSLF
ncbi:MAG: exodeoxyribonuclease VII large subunit [Rhizomicrobium sp.]